MLLYILASSGLVSQANASCSLKFQHSSCGDHGVCVPDSDPRFPDPFFNQCQCYSGWAGDDCSLSTYCWGGNDCSLNIWYVVAIPMATVFCCVALIVLACCLCCGRAGARRRPRQVEPAVMTAVVPPPPRPSAPQFEEQPTTGDFTPNPNMEVLEFTVVVPQGRGPGCQLYVMAPTGQQVMVTVPDGVHAGQTFCAQL